MSSDVNNTFGFELLQKIHCKDVTSKEDIFILFVHWYFIRSGFKCLGAGDSKDINPDEKGSELLPESWNKAPNFSLRYIKDGKLYILMAVKSETDFLFNLLRVEDQRVTNVSFPVDTIERLNGPLELLIPNYESILQKIKQDLHDPVYLSSGTDMSTQTSQITERRDIDDPLRVGPRQWPDPGRGQPVFDPVPGIGSIGRRDLDPLGGLEVGGAQGGGMIFDPFSENRRNTDRPGLGIGGLLPRGAVPPGARFDPFGPPDNDNVRPGVNRQGGDHLPPPGFDNMFM